MSVFGFKPDVRKLEADQDVKGLINALQYQDTEVRLFAAKALANFSSQDACPALITNLKDDNEEVRNAATTALVAMGEIALPLLFNAMGDQSWLVRRGATQALTRLRWSPDDDEIKVCFLFAQGAWTELAGYKKKAIPHLIEGLNDENAMIRKGAAQSLGTIGEPEGFEPLTRAIADPDTEVRAPAAFALGELKDPRGIPFLVNLFYDNNAGVRNAAADALAVIGMPAFEPLVAALNDSKTSAWLAAIRALGKIQNPRVIPPLIGKLEDAFPEMRSSAAVALGEIGGPELPMILDVMKKGSRIARLACLDAFAKCPDNKVTEILVEASKGVDEQIAQKAGVILRKREGLKVWQTPLEDDMESPTSTSIADIWNIRQERKAFEQIGSQETDKIIAVLRDDNQNDRLRAILRRVNEGRPVVEALVMIMKSKDDEIRRRAVEAIDRLEDISASPFLVALHDNDPFIRTVAARNLGKLGCLDAIIPLLHHACEDRDSFVGGTAGEAVLRMGSHPNLKIPVGDVLIRALTDDSPKIRANSAELLGNLGSAFAVPALISLFRDRDETVQTTAAEALEEIGRQAFPSLAQAAYDPDPRTRCGAFTELAEFGEKGEAYLMEGIRDSNPDVRAHAKKILYSQKHGQDVAVAPKAGMTGIPSIPQVKPVAQKNVPAAPSGVGAALPDPGVYISQLASRDKTVRLHAIKCLAAMGEIAFRPLIYTAYNPDKAMRIGALQALSRFGTMGAPYIVKALEDPDLDVQHSAYRILNQLDGKNGLPRVGGSVPAAGTPVDCRGEETPALRSGVSPRQSHSGKLYPADIVPHLSDNNGYSRERAIEVLTRMGEPAFLPLVYAAYSPDKAMRIGALHALAHFGTMGAPHIILALEDSDLDVQHAVYQILTRQDGKNGLPRVGGPALNAGTPHECGGTPAAAPSAGTPPVNLDGITDPRELVDFLDHANKDVQMNAAMALAMMGGAAAPALIEAFSYGNKDTRATAAEIIGSLGPDAVGPLMDALGDTRSDVVAGAASVLGKLGDKQAVPALVSLLDKNANGTGIVAAEALGYLGDTESVEALIRALNGSDSELQSGAARALGYIGDERAVSSLIEALGSEDFTVRRIAMDALIGIGEPSIPYLSEALLHSERGVRSGAAECFMQMGYAPKTPEEQINLLVANEEWLELTKRGTSAVEVLIYFVDDANEEVRAGATAALGHVGGARAVGTLARLLADDNIIVRRKATESLTDMGETIVPDLQKLLLTTPSPVQQQAIDQVLERVNRKTPSGKGRK